jgi:polyhydroxybutyrate depolymerase
VARCSLSPHFAVVSFALLAALACSGEDEGGNAPPPFQGLPGSNTPAPTGNGVAPGPTTTAPGNGGGDTVPATGLMQPQPVATGTGNGTVTPAPTGSATTTPPPVEPPPAGSTPSAGCGRAQGIPANYQVANTIVTFPPSYDGTTPVPLLFAFHGANRSNAEMQMQDSRTVGSELEGNYVMAFMKSAGNAWDLNTDYPRFETALTQLESELCVDTAHLFAMGHSSGAQFIVQMLGNAQTREDRFAAVAPVSSSLFNNEPWNPVPTLLIHGLNDTARPNDLNGAQDISQYARANQCGAGTTPVDIGSCNSIAQGNPAVNPGCVSYDGCGATTLFCNHNDPNYIDNGTPTNHGWPCFANQQIFDFLEATR